jgi:hypothetical protein
MRIAGDERQHGQRQRNSGQTSCIGCHENTHLLPGDENDPTFWFNQPWVGMQCSDTLDEQFGWDCMLGKLCRLAKRCQRASTLDARSDPAAQSANQKIRLVLRPIIYCTRQASGASCKETTAFRPTMRCGNISVRSCNDCIDRGIRGARVDGASIQPTRYVAAGKRFDWRRCSSWRS